MTHEKNRRARDIQAAPSTAGTLKQLGSPALKSILAFVSVVIVLLSAVGYFSVGRLGGEMASVSNLGLGDKDKDPNTSDGAVDILLVGSDSRTDAQGNTLSDKELETLHAGVAEGEENTDTMMLIRVPDDGSRATAVSIPRDTYVDQGEMGNMKINGVYAAHKEAEVDKLKEENAAAEAAGDKPKYTDKEIDQKGVEAGRAALLEQIKDLTGVGIDHYAEVGLLGFVLLTDAVGGVDVCLNEAVDDEMSGAKFDKGEQTIEGAEALAFVRQRYELPRGDLDRIVRQQAFMASLVSKMLDRGTLTNPNTLSKISEAVERSVVIDEGWDVMGFITQLAGLAGGNVTFTTIPVTSINGQGDYGESIVTVDKKAVHKFIDDLAKPQEAKEAEESAAAESSAASESPKADGASESGAKPTIQVLNAGSVSGLASQIGSWATGQGYEVESTSNAQPGIYSESQVVAADASDERATELAEKLGGLPVTANPSLDSETLIIVAADDYSGPADEEAAASATEEPVGTPGADFGAAEVAPEIDAGGDGPRCVN